MKFFMTSILGLLMMPCMAFDDHDYMDDEICQEQPLSSECGRVYASIEYQKADVELNSVYKRVIEAIKKDDYVESSMYDPEKAISALRETQRKWIAFRDTECALMFHFFEGPFLSRDTQEIECSTEMTVKRTEKLKGFLPD